MPHPVGPRSVPIVLRRKQPRLILLCLMIVLALIACNLPFNQPADQYEIALDEAQAIYDQAGISLEEQLAVEPEDRRPTIIEQLGPPDAFTLRWIEIEGQLVRWEEWSYFDFQSRFDFVDGELLWTLDIDPAPNGSIYAHTFDPMQFKFGQARDEIVAMLPLLEWQEISLADGDIPDGILLASDQILLGFEQSQLTYVQTFILEPEEVIELVLPTAVDTIGDTSLLDDEFNDPAVSASPYFDSEYMQYSISNGAGRLTSNYNGMLPALYRGIDIADFNLTVDLTIPSIKPDGAYGLLFRGRQEDEGLSRYYYLSIQPGEQTIRLDRYQDDSFHRVSSVSFQEMSINPGVPFQLRILAQGTHIEIHLNQQPLLVVDDPAGLADSGLIGLTIASEPGDWVEFDNLRVEPVQ